MTDQFKRFYRMYRDHQRTLANAGQGGLTVYPSGRTERSYGSAPYGEHALAAFMAAKRSVYFHARYAK